MTSLDKLPPWKSLPIPTEKVGTESGKVIRESRRRARKVAGEAEIVGDKPGKVGADPEKVIKSRRRMPEKNDTEQGKLPRNSVDPKVATDPKK